MKRKNKTGLIGIIITISILIFLIFITNVNENKFLFLKNVFSKITVPIQNGVVLLKNKIENNNYFFVELAEIKNINQKLVEENETLKQKVNEIDALKAENKNYKNYLKLVENYNEYEMVPCYVIDYDYSNYGFNIVLNVGLENGIKEGMVVVNEQGVVGYVISVTENTSKVKTIVDTSNYMSASINDINNSVVCNGILNERKKIKGTFIESNQQVSVGDLVQTNGLGGIYPKGLTIGTIEEIIDTKNITDRYIYIKLSVDFNNLEYLVVIKN